MMIHWTVAKSQLLTSEQLTESAKPVKSLCHIEKASNPSTMAEINVSLQQQQSHESNPSLPALFHALDPISLILNQNSSSDHPVPLKLTTANSFIMERGPRYEAYAELREAKLRRKYARAFEEDEEPKRATPPRKQVKFQTNLASGRKGSSVLAQSVPDFSAVLRKENRKPTNTLPSLPEMTPPAKSFSKANNGVLSNSRGSKSASAGEKKGGNGRILMARKSYANIDELKSLSSYAANAINGETRGGRSNGCGGGRVVGNGKTVLGYRQY